jgi:hypothetical protein
MPALVRRSVAGSVFSSTARPLDRVGASSAHTGESGRHHFGKPLPVRPTACSTSSEEFSR